MSHTKRAHVRVYKSTGRKGYARRSDCNKFAYPSKAKAKRKAREVTTNTGDAAYAYSCLGCGFYHLTSRRPNVGADRSRRYSLREEAP